MLNRGGNKGKNGGDYPAYFPPNGFSPPLDSPSFPLPPINDSQRGRQTNRGLKQMSTHICFFLYSLTPLSLQIFFLFILLRTRKEMRTLADYRQLPSHFLSYPILPPIPPAPQGAGGRLLFNL